MKWRRKKRAQSWPEVGDDIFIVAVPQGWSVEQAWEAFNREKMYGNGSEPWWAVVEARGRELVHWFDEDELESISSSYREEPS